MRCIFDLQLRTIVNFLVPELAKLHPGQIIDIGAGEAPWRSRLPDHCSYQGLDVLNYAHFGMTSAPDIAIYDGVNIPFDSNTFSGALCIEVLEHATNPELLLSEIFRVLKNGAPLLLSVPWSARRHHIPFDFHRFTKERLHQLLSHSGFTQVEVKERGNDYCVVFNKVLLLIVRNARALTIFNWFYRIPVMISLTPFTLLMLVISHISLLVPKQGNEDPLGYFCVASKPRR